MATDKAEETLPHPLVMRERIVQGRLVLRLSRRNQGRSKHPEDSTCDSGEMLTYGTHGKVAKIELSYHLNDTFKRIACLPELRPCK